MKSSPFKPPRVICLNSFIMNSITKGFSTSKVNAMHHQEKVLTPKFDCVCKRSLEQPIYRSFEHNAN